MMTRGWRRSSAAVLIDRQVAAAGWSVQDMRDLNLFASEGVACREVVMKPGHGRADYLLYIDKKVVGVSPITWASKCSSTPRHHSNRGRQTWLLRQDAGRSENSEAGI